MAHQVKWSEELLSMFITLAPLTEEETKVIDMRVRKGYSMVKQASELGVSIATINRMTKILKLKYDNCVERYPDKFPKRGQENVWKK